VVRKLEGALPGSASGLGSRDGATCGGGRAPSGAGGRVAVVGKAEVATKSMAEEHEEVMATRPVGRETRPGVGWRSRPAQVEVLAASVDNGTPRRGSGAGHILGARVGGNVGPRSG
jgi:hypothetical protein